MVEVTHDEIMEFAQRYNPQPFHLDDAAPTRARTAARVASSSHTAAVPEALSGSKRAANDESRACATVRTADRAAIAWIEG